MKQKIIWSLIGCLFFLFAIIAKLPAQLVLARLPLPDFVGINHVSGTVWHGYATQIAVQGMLFNGVEWQISPWQLLLGKMQLDLNAGKVREVEQAAIKGSVVVPLWAPTDISLSSARIYLPAGPVLRQLPLPLPVMADGRIKIDINQLHFSQMQCQYLSGQGEWLNARVLGINGMIDFGNFSSLLDCEQNQFRLRVESPNSLGLTLSALVSKDLRQVTGQGQFKLSTSLPDEVHQAATFFGKAGKDGVTSFSF